MKPTLWFLKGYKGMPQNMGILKLYLYYIHSRNRCLDPKRIPKHFDETNLATYLDP